jgi:hypothetical protein
MPLIRSNSVAPGSDELVAILVSELRQSVTSDQPVHQPIILENEIGQTHTLHVVVIWQRWQIVPTGQRSGLIIRAYDEAAADRADRITIAMGVTTEEAIELGLLPFEVVPVIRKEDNIDAETVRELMREEGATESANRIVLRFPSLEMAESAFRRLCSKSSTDYWAVRQDL